MKKSIDIGQIEGPDFLDIDIFIANLISLKEKGANKIRIYSGYNGEVYLDAELEREETPEEEQDRLSAPKRNIKLTYYPIERTSE